MPIPERSLTVVAGRVYKQVEANESKRKITEGAGMGGSTGVVLAVQLAPTLDPPYDDAGYPPTGMDLLPIDWSPTSARSVAGARTPEEKPPARAAVPAAAPAGPAPISARQAMQRYIAMCVEVLNGSTGEAVLFEV